MAAMGGDKGRDKGDRGDRGLAAKETEDATKETKDATKETKEWPPKGRGED